MKHPLQLRNQLFTPAGTTTVAAALVAALLAAPAVGALHHFPVPVQLANAETLGRARYLEPREPEASGGCDCRCHRCRRWGCRGGERR